MIVYTEEIDSNIIISYYCYTFIILVNGMHNVRINEKKLFVFYYVKENRNNLYNIFVMDNFHQLLLPLYVTLHNYDKNFKLMLRCNCE